MSTTSRVTRTWRQGDPWTVSDASELYEIDRWGKGYFSIGPNGHVRVHATKDPERAIDLKQLVDHLQLRGIGLPILIRFRDILRQRLADIHSAFQSAITHNQYEGRYFCVYPIKVNQQRQVVEEVLDFGRPYDFGLEAGSKPELLAVVAMATNETPIICNGFKDAEFIETAMLAHKMGRRIIPVVEKYTELGLVLEYARKVGVRPNIGMRVKLAARGGGRWQSSGGYRSKFGLTVAEVRQGLEELKSYGMQDCFKLLHFHLGSQIPNIRIVKGALNEAARIYTELVKDGAGLEYLDVGGGLGVDYDGSQTNFESSVNYTLEEYANDVVYHIQSVCDDAGVKHADDRVGEWPRDRGVPQRPRVQRAGRLGLRRSRDPAERQRRRSRTAAGRPERDVPEPHVAQRARELPRRAAGARHGAQPVQWRISAAWTALPGRDALLGDLHEAAEARSQAWTTSPRTCRASTTRSPTRTSAISRCSSRFPIRGRSSSSSRSCRSIGSTRSPTRQAVLGDITCDSDGKIDQFIDRRDVKRTIALHQFTGEPYYLGVFLVGAYQEILGDLHNLFGDTHAVHVSLDQSGGVVLESVIKGDTVREVLDYVQFDADMLVRKFRDAVEAAVRDGRMDFEESGRLIRFYEDGLHGYTYLEDPSER